MLYELQHVSCVYKNKALQHFITIVALILRQQMELKLVTITHNVDKKTEFRVKLTKNCSTVVQRDWNTKSLLGIDRT